MMRKTVSIAAIAIISMLLGAGWASAQQAGAAPPAAARGAVQAPAPPELLFSVTLRNDTRLPLTQNSITTPNVDLQLYGDGKNIVVAVGKGANLPRTFFGLCEKPC